MQLSKNYTKPSITEAVIDFKVDFPINIDISVLKELQHKINTDYPVCEEIVILSVQGQIQTAPSLEATATQSLVGYRFLSSDGKQIFQARLDSFTFSRLVPYNGWEKFRDEAKRLWNMYRHLTNLKSVNRVAVRYINRLDLPLSIDLPLDLKDYLRTVPEVSSDLSKGLSGYFMQLQIPQEDLQAMLVLNEAIIPPSKENVVSVLLDIDLACDVNLSNNENAEWDLLEKLRIRKNEAFEACITDNTRRLLQ